jgi:hypothetical protein
MSSKGGSGAVGALAGRQRPGEAEYLGVCGSEPLLEVADLFEMASALLFQLTG